jgi:hypothetical protein
MPANRLELPDSRHPRHDGQVPLAADLRARRATGVADDSDVRGFDELKGHSGCYTRVQLGRKPGQTRARWPSALLDGYVSLGCGNVPSPFAEGGPELHFDENARHATVVETRSYRRCRSENRPRSRARLDQQAVRGRPAFDLALTPRLGSNA